MCFFTIKKCLIKKSYIWERALPLTTLWYKLVTVSVRTFLVAYNGKQDQLKPKLKGGIYQNGIRMAHETKDRKCTIASGIAGIKNINCIRILCLSFLLYSLLIYSLGLVYRAEAPPVKVSSTQVSNWTEAQSLSPVVHSRKGSTWVSWLSTLRPTRQSLSEGLPRREGGNKALGT